MQHVIQLLPDHIANQIAAGEVVQRPASVVKELLENAIDAGANRLDLILKDAGKALIQVIDNGAGMSSQDARMAFERHATSKIRESADLFNIQTMGFRGEAMASIAAVAQVHLKARLHTEELGTEIVIEGSTIKKHEPCMAPKGTSVAVKNLFFNVPARRNFLKSNPVETRHIINEFIRVALAQPDIAMRLEHNGTEVYNLIPADPEGRIVQLFGKILKGKLIPINEQTPYISIYGFLGLPEAARRKRGDQYFFVNRRFIKSGYLNHAVTTAYQRLIPEDTFPFYCIFFDIAPEHIDINIHPTKTEIKFDDERTVYQLLHSVIRKGLGDFHQAPTDLGASEKDFLELLKKNDPPSLDETTIGQVRAVQPPVSRPSRGGNNLGSGWDQLYKAEDYARPQAKPKQNAPDFLFPEIKPKPPAQVERPQEIFEKKEDSDVVLTQLGQRYILHQGPRGLLIIDQCHAHQRILFERFLKANKRNPLPSQQLLFPRTLNFSPVDFSFLREIIHEVNELGFDLNEFGPNTFILHGVPAVLKGSKAELFFEEIIAEVRETGTAAAVKEKVHEALAKTIALRSAMTAGKKLGNQEMRNIVDELFRCEQAAWSPSQKPTIYRLEWKDLEQFFQGKG